VNSHFPHLLATACLAIVAPPPSPLPAQTSGDPSVSAKVLTSEVVAGEFGNLIYTIDGGAADMPRRIDTPGLEILHSKEHSSIEIVNGRQSLKTVHYYRFRGRETGSYTIPPVTITVDGETFETRAIEIEIVERDESAGESATRPVFGKLELSKEEFYVNEIVPFTLIAYVRGRNSINDIVRPELEHESFVIKQFREVRTDGGQLGNTYYSSATIPSNLFALKPGEHQLGPAELGVRTLDSGDSFGFSGFFQRAVLEEIATNAVTVTVNPLPSGAPESFTGGVGRFEMTGSPSTTEVSVGDPISMEFEVTGSGNFRTMSAPVFAASQDGVWKSYDPKKTLEEDEDSRGSEPESVRFSRVIIPQVETDTIPAFELTYFDPDEESYVTTATDPVSIRVAADPGGGTSAPVRLSGSSATELPGPAADSPTPRFDGVLHIRTNSPRWVAQAGGWSPGPGFYVAQAVLSVAFFTIVGFGLVRGFRRYGLARSGASAPLTFRQSVKRVPGPGSSRREFYRAVSECLDLWRREHPDAPPRVREVVDDVGARCDAFLYGGGGEPSDTPISQQETDEFRGILRKLPRQ